jgi:cobalt-zinc-cadmium efflux system protein
LTVVLALNLALVVGLILVGLTAHSLGVLAAALDYVADAAAIAVSLVAIRLSRRPDLPGRPNRFRRATAWAAGVNGAWLLGLSALVVTGAIDRLTGTPPAVHGLPVLVISGISALTMFAGAAILRGDADRRGLNDDDADAGRELAIRAVVLDTVADAAIALGVALTGAIILLTHGLFWLDPAVAIGVSLVVAFHAVQLLRDVAAHLAPQGS